MLSFFMQGHHFLAETHTLQGAAANINMRTPTSQRTSEGVSDATHWLVANTSVIRQMRRVLVQYYHKHSRDFPWRRTTNPYQLLVAEVLLQKTGAKPVIDTWYAFLERYPDVRALAAAPVVELEALLAPLGLVRRRAAVLHAAAHQLIRDHGGTVPKDAAALAALPGVGSYTAAAILSFAWNIPAPTIDVNAARVYARIGGFAPRTLRQGLAFAQVVGERVVTQRAHQQVNYGVLDLAAQICRPQPRCTVCPARGLCQYARESQQAVHPLPADQHRAALAQSCQEAGDA